MKSTKECSNNSNYPRNLSSIVISMGLLAGFVTFTSWVLLSNLIGTAVRSYFYSVSETRDFGFPVSWQNVTPVDSNNNEKTSSLIKEYSESRKLKNDGIVAQPQANKARNTDHDKELNQLMPPGNGTVPESVAQGIEKNIALDKDRTTGGDREVNRSISLHGETVPESDAQSVKKENALHKDGNTDDNEEVKQSIRPGNETSPKSAHQSNEKENLVDNLQPPSTSTFDLLLGDETYKEPVKTECDLYHGHWFYDPSGPLYTNNTCPVITQMQNCQGNGRPDKEYENWRWRPTQCDLPRFDGKKFLDLMSGKTLAFVGDSVARNQMESLLCMLWQVEVPKNRGNRHMQRWYFRSKSVMIVRIWSSWLVHQSPEPFSYAPQGVVKVYLDVPDETFMQYIPQFDVVILSSGHWFAKQSVYILNNEIVGTQLWSPPEPHDLRVNNIEAFGISTEMILTAMATHLNYTGLTIVRSFSPDHYEGGAWNTGGSCTGKMEPLPPGKLVENAFINIMHEKQVMGFEKAVKKLGNGLKLKLMDITKAFSIRHDGHPGPFRSPDPNKKTKRGPDGRPPPQDCLHWCMPGPVDTWNELVLEIIRREFEGSEGLDQ